jgi:hypothetical protein
MYIILLRPERNNRALFTTSKSIRCHIGTRVASAISSKSSNSYSSTESPRYHLVRAVYILYCWQCDSSSGLSLGGEGELGNWLVSEWVGTVSGWEDNRISMGVQVIV